MGSTHPLSEPRHSCPREHIVLHHNLLQVAFDRAARTITVAYIKVKAKPRARNSSLVVLEGVVQGTVLDVNVAEWATDVMQALYEGKHLRFTDTLRVIDFQ